MISLLSPRPGILIRVGESQSFSKIIAPPPFFPVGSRPGVALQNLGNQSFVGDLDFEPGLQYVSI